MAEIVLETELTPNKLHRAVEKFYKNIENYNKNYDKQLKINGKSQILAIINKYFK